MRSLAQQTQVQEGTGPKDEFAAGENTPGLAKAPAPLPQVKKHHAADKGDALLKETAQAVAERSKAASEGGDLESLKQKRKDLRTSIKALPKGGSLKEAARLHQTLRDTQDDLKSLERFKREQSWEKLQSEGKSHSKTYENFFVSGRTPIRTMKEVLQVSDELADPNSPRRLKGNKIEVLTRGEVWQKKMELMEEAASQPKRDGKPVCVDAEYFELSSPDAIEKLARAARGGAKVRVLVDSGRLQPDGDNLDATSLASRLGTFKNLENGSRGQAGVQFFANQEVLGSRGDLMHRKLLRVGDTVLFGGMNANSGSGENVDNGMTMQGPAARNQAEGFQRDLDRSEGRSVEQIFGKQLQDLREKENITVTPQGLLSLAEAAGTQGPKAGRSQAERVDAALESAAFQGVNLRDLAHLPDSDGDGKVGEADERAYLLAGKGSVQLTAQGREFLANGLEKSVEKMNAASNRSRLAAGPLPNDKKVGTDTVAIGDSGAERTAMLLHTIDTAEKSIDVSAFVVSEEVARALVDKRDRMKAEGKPFDVRVVLDPGVYGYGGTPNEKGYRHLEDNGIPVKWAVLDRSNPGHDRKVHAKLMVTDKMMLTGSTNFSSKALQANWELSDVVYFGDDEAAKAQQQELRGDFDKLWERESMSLNTRELADRKFADRKPGPERDLLVERYRSRTMLGFLRGIETYERSMGENIQAELQNNPSLAFNLDEKVKGGAARGYALWDLLGAERVGQMREKNPDYRNLIQIANHGL